MFCTNCGKELPDKNVSFCPYCGKRINGGAPNNAAPSGETQPSYGPVYHNPDDVPNGGWTVLGFFFPLIGFILYLVFQTTYPNRSRLCGKGALIGLIVDVGIGIIVAIIYVCIFVVYMSNPHALAVLCLL